MLKNKFMIEILVGTVPGSLNVSGDASPVSPLDSAPVRYPMGAELPQKLVGTAVADPKNLVGTVKRI